MPDTNIALEVRVAVLEKQQATFERSAVGFMQHAANEENSIHERLDELVSEVHKIPEMVSTKINESRTEMRTEIDKAHPRRHEVVTPRALYAFAGILALVLVAGMTTTMVVWDKIDDAGHRDIAEQIANDPSGH